MVYGVILAGGRGERFWPLSKRDRPKQFLKLTSDKTMLEETIDRVLPLIPMERVRIVTGQSMSDFIYENVASVKEENLLAEPTGRNTCAAIGLAAVHLLKESPDAIMVVLSADHLIRPPERLLEIIETGVGIARLEECLMTIGIVPTRAETGYGYIKMGEAHDHAGSVVVRKVSDFAEKPKAAVANEYYYSGNYLWNSGMFIWSAKAILNAIEQHAPIMSAKLKEYEGTIGTPDEVEARIKFYEQVQPVSIDVAILEKASNVLTIKGDIIWDDIGGWNALPRYKTANIDHNVLVGETYIQDSYENIVYNDEEGLVACIGVADLVIVRSGKITMVCHKTKTDSIKEALARLEADEKTRKYL